MTEDQQPDDWHEAVDLLCVGTGPGVLAFGMFCAAADLDVLIVESGELDPQTMEWRTAMTADLDDCPQDPRLALIHANPVSAEKVTDRTKLEPFVGEHLRQWSSRCLASPFGVLATEVPALDPIRTADGESITAGVVGSFRFPQGLPGPALSQWLRERAEHLLAPVDDRLDGLIVIDGRIAGVVLKTADGPCRIGSAHGIALSPGRASQSWPDQPELAGVTVDVAVLGRRAGRFATVGLLAR